MMEENVERISEHFYNLEKKKNRHFYDADHLFDEYGMSPKKEASFIEMAKNNREFCDKATTNASALFRDEMQHVIQHNSNMINLIVGHQ